MGSSETAITPQWCNARRSSLCPPESGSSGIRRLDNRLISAIIHARDESVKREASCVSTDRKRPRLLRSCSKRLVSP
ncbi:hypothetical protein QR680_018576 [Steinernema hermaphroditum]|uniref:Uncharacterized protein n=1 Tax=Steinernema hermaphroditum TaxID=289476 RepID=A0AA39HIF3_9BILA|nr:hypothetical protein QR680_018576 [Steinernema hermaphroditum]